MSGKPNCKRCLKPKSECSCGRKEVITKDVLQKLEDAFMFCYSDIEACLYAGISPRTLYYFQEKHPEFLQRKQALRLTPNLSAKKELVASIKGNLAQARWWAQNKMKDEFGEKTTLRYEGRTETEHSAEHREGVAEAVKLFNEKMREVLTRKKPENSKQL